MDRRTFLAGAIGIVAIPPGAHADSVTRIRDLYNKDLSFSDLASGQEGRRISVTGYMAPPLKAESTFFVLTARPMAVCPFCESEAQWPNDILAVYTKRVIDIVPFNIPIVARGTLALGGYKDPDTGFVSRVRVTDATFERS